MSTTDRWLSHAGLNFVIGRPGRSFPLSGSTDGIPGVVTFTCRGMGGPPIRLHLP
ncbi:hypothetical protein [Actinosynnema mirum]|uniref:hypothetical protein n=1 Tax=Actinosynnema mirum TaxID=40567 RepID=UPI0002E550D6|nr:hypothetical protein [Actinosynnema mirum]